MVLIQYDELNDKYLHFPFTVSLTAILTRRLALKLNNRLPLTELISFCSTNGFQHV